MYRLGNCSRWLLVCAMVISASSERLLAETAEKLCRSAVRAEMMGANCRISDPKSVADPCFIPGESKLALTTKKLFSALHAAAPESDDS